VLATLLAASVVLFAVVGPSATVVVAPSPGARPVRVRPARGSERRSATTSAARTSAQVSGTATGSRTEEAKAKGTERFTNLTTSEILIRGARSKTQDNIQFQTTEDKTLPRTTFVIFPPSVTAGTVDIAIEAVEAGTRGNVDARKINQSPNPSQYSVENPQATAGGDLQEDPDRPAGRLPARRFTGGPRAADAGRRAARDVEEGGAADQAVRRGRSIDRHHPAGDVVGKELKVEQPTFELTATARRSRTAWTRVATARGGGRQARSETASGYDVDPQGAGGRRRLPCVEEDGGIKRARRAAQFRHLDEAAIRAARGPAARDRGGARGHRGARAYAEERVDVAGWWPRLPILDTRIQVKGEAPAGLSADRAVSCARCRRSHHRSRGGATTRSHRADAADGAKT
jgi:hypothetical protein